MKRLMLATVLAGLLVVTFACACSHYGLVCTFTGSLPSGIYRKVDEPVTRGSYVSFDPAGSPKITFFIERYAINGVRHLWMKRVVAVAGDCVALSPNGLLMVNGHAIAGSKWLPLRCKAGGRLRAMPRYPMIICDGECFLHGSSPFSIDSRYFGPVPLDLITEVNRPVVIIPRRR